MSTTERQAAAAQYKATLESLNAKYQAAIPAARKWAYSLTTQDLRAKLADHGVSHVSDLVHIIARNQAIA
jgi:hypothetical protein